MCKKLIFLLYLIIASIVINAKEQEGYKVGCVKCHPIDENKITIHLIPHSHDDVGWVKTVDEYFYGMNSQLTQASVSLIISSVVEALKQYPNRRFVQVETAFFHKWWEENENLRKDFKNLVHNGQIEIVNGAWSMNDEACVNYQSTIDQFTWGLRKIEEAVGKCGRPRVGWQIDPFGHSREHASILSQMGFDGVFFARMDHDDKEKRIINGELDFLWKGSANIDDSIIFGSCFPNELYNEPNNFCWDIECTDEQIIDNPKSPLYNVKKIVKKFEEVLKNFTAYYPSGVKNIILPMGGDFQYQAASANYKNMDRLINGFQNYNTEFNLIYSTPSCYIKAVNDAKPKLTLKTDDFFPYSDRDNAFWTGYFTSRPTIKRFERTGHNILQAAKQIYALSFNRSHDEKLENLRETMGVLQHHDAITGTETQHVNDDYIRMLTAAIREAEEPIGKILSEILESDIVFNISTCLLTNMSICSTSQSSDKFVVVVYNPLAWKTTHYIRLPVEYENYEITGPDGTEQYDIIDTLYSFDFVVIKNEKPSLKELIFAARNIEPMGFKLYHIQKVKKEKIDNNNILKSVTDTTAFKIDSETNLLQSVTMNGVSIDVNQNFYFYESNDGFNEAVVTSGAYIFRPTENQSTIALSDVKILRSFSGNLVEEVHQKWKSNYLDIYQSIRWYKSENYLEFDWIVGNIDLNTLAVGKEIISRFDVANFNNKDTFYTDSNGREMLKRIKNCRPTYSYNFTKEPVASNYYPVTSKIVIKDEESDLEVAVLTDRSQGGTSLNKGQIELMVHRRLIFDDGRGVQEGLDEYEFGQGLYVRGSHYLVIGAATQPNNNNISTAALERILAQKKLVQPWVGLSTTNLTFKELNNSIKFSYSAMKKELPDNINILTLEPWSNNSYLLRLEHIMEKDEDPLLSKPVTIPDIKNLFNGIKFVKVTETALAAHFTLAELEEKEKYSWNTENSFTLSKFSKGISNDGAITLNPMEIKTFILHTNSSSRYYFNFILCLFLNFIVNQFY